MEHKVNEAAQAQRRKDAIRSAVVSTAWMALIGAVVLYLRFAYRIEGLGGAVMVIAALLELGMILPVWILLKTRLKEIEGGEEDAAAQY